LHTIKKRYFVWLGACVFLSLLFHLLKENRAVMNAIASFTAPVKLAAAGFCASFPFSVAEAMVAAAILLLCLWIVLFIRAAFRAKRKSAALLQRVLGLLCAALTIYTLFCCLWGANYYADGFQDRSGLHAQPSSVEQLYRTTLYFAAQTAVYSGEVPRDETGCFSEGIDTLFRQSADLYPAVEREYPFLTIRALPPKPVFFSRLMSRFSFTGFYFPFTGEANINVDAPRSIMPATIAHELAHQRGIAAEDEANFAAILACVKSDLPNYAYSGYLLGYIHLGNALYSKSADLYAEAYSLLTPETIADLRQNNAYWQRYEGAVSDLGSEVYDSYLKGYGQDLGVESYGAVADLLIAWHASTQAAAQP